MKLASIFKNGVVRAIIAGALFIVAILIFSIDIPLPLWQKLIIVGVAGILEALMVYYEVEKVPQIRIEEILRLMIVSLYGRDLASHYRANVMVWDDNKRKLVIKYAYNMEGARDRNIELDKGQGCAGQAFENETPFLVDLTKHKHEDFKVDPQRVWTEMQAVLSVPLFKVDAVAGVLNIDTDRSVEESRFGDEEIYNIVSAYGDLVGLILGFR